VWPGTAIVRTMVFLFAVYGIYELFVYLIYLTQSIRFFKNKWLNLIITQINFRV
jgi:hypothetical protein